MSEDEGKETDGEAQSKDIVTHSLALRSAFCVLRYVYLVILMLGDNVEDGDWDNTTLVTSPLVLLFF